ncbi:YgiW/YdeI family stress tolerance OB fold protein [Bordetella avium]|uniref:Exported protein n=1 Tax=Bordetella avium (strain 197N) TaxID=360910 RepID=Q2L0T1_BORA1|nr:NirD/YgiW/YdeI family stress tolerance protein [Bordetella avium]WQE32060.1 NirD/YgiW/YdeI family stress tolerance protein [Bordetella avium]CAJ49436.1 putative exported protein [Bordetella avium 197N]SUV68903.1 Uncharacterized conserved protein [Bordetella avium]
MSVLRKSLLRPSLLGLSLASGMLALLWLAPASAQYVGPQVNPNMSISQMMKNAPDDAHVTLRGHLVRQINHEKYLLDDGTGQIRVEIDPHLFPRGTPVGPQTLVEVSGELDRELVGLSEVDVKSLRIIQDGAAAQPAVKAPAP